jgi:predicted ATPase
MIKTLRLSKFQGFAEEFDVPLRPITLIYGPNGSGKSSILRALRFLQQSLDHEHLGKQPGQFVFSGESINLTSFANAVHQHNSRTNFTIGIAANSPSDNTLRSRSLQEIFETVEFTWVVADPGILDSITLNFVLHKQLGNIYFAFKREGRSVVLTGFSGTKEFSYVEDFASQNNQKEDSKANALGEYEFEFMDDYFISSKDVPWETLAKGLRYDLRGVVPVVARTGLDGSAEKQAKLIAEMFSVARAWLARHFGNLEYVGPLREISQRISLNSVNQVDLRQDAARSKRSEKVQQAISDWIFKLTHGRYEYKQIHFQAEEVAFLGHMQAEMIVDTLTGTHVSFEDVGVGLSQVLPILQSISQADQKIMNGAVPILIEQPELHLHPRMQGDLMDLMIESVRNTNGLQIIAETHSESMLLRLQKRLRSGAISQESVSVLYVDQIDQGNFVSIIPVLKSNDFEIDLPVSFAGLRLGEILE